MKNDKLKSTTVRFTESDLRVIACLHDKLGIGVIQVIRLAIRRLAEIENILPDERLEIEVEALCGVAPLLAENQE